MDEELREFLVKNPQATLSEVRSANFICSGTKLITLKTRLGLTPLPDAQWLKFLTDFVKTHPEAQYRDYVKECTRTGYYPVVSATTFRKYTPVVRGILTPDPQPVETQTEAPQPAPVEPVLPITVSGFQGALRKQKYKPRSYKQVEYFLGVFPQGTYEQFLLLTSNKSITPELFATHRSKVMDKFPMLRSKGATYTVIFSLDLDGVSQQSQDIIHGIVAGLNRVMINPLQIVIYGDTKRTLEIRRVTL